MITTEKLKILNALKLGPQTHLNLRMAYYGIERFKNPSNTSFYNQLQRMMEAGLIRKNVVGIYDLTELGRHTIGLGWDCDFCGRTDNKHLICSGCAEGIEAYNMCIA